MCAESFRSYGEWLVGKPTVFDIYSIYPLRVKTRRCRSSTIMRCMSATRATVIYRRFFTMTWSTASATTLRRMFDASLRPCLHAPRARRVPCLTRQHQAQLHPAGVDFKGPSVACSASEGHAANTLRLAGGSAGAPSWRWHRAKGARGQLGKMPVLSLCHVGHDDVIHRVANGSEEVPCIFAHSHLELGGIGKVYTDARRDARWPRWCGDVLHRLVRSNRLVVRRGLGGVVGAKTPFKLLAVRAGQLCCTSGAHHDSLRPIGVGKLMAVADSLATIIAVMGVGHSYLSFVAENRIPKLTRRHLKYRSQASTPCS